MSKAYPTRTDDSYPTLQNLLPEDACIVCKRRPARERGGLCAPCAERLEGGG